MLSEKVFLEYDYNLLGSANACCGGGIRKQDAHLTLSALDIILDCLEQRSMQEWLHELQQGKEPKRSKIENMDDTPTF